MTTMSNVLDPVCGMTIDPAKAAGSSQYEGETIYFCSKHCKAKFDADPSVYRGSEAHDRSHHDHDRAQYKDPVCGMTIDPAKAAGSSEYEGETIR